MDKILNIAKGLHIPVLNYASQGNAILGIRDSGKTYTGTKAAEELLDAGIPIIVYDPIGIWRFLKVGVNGHKGYDIVVAGDGEGADIPLTPKNAVQIVRMAMQEGISLVVDLYSPSLANKSTWIKIVQDTIRTLMYENKDYQLRHIILEEAAEFIPQRLQPQHAQVYAEVERLARIGRNAKLGFTLINQRAEEVNKAILELCDLTLLHKQVGKNSLFSIKKWMEIRQVANVKDILNTVPKLEQGECWVVGYLDEPIRVKILPKHTFHPDPKKAGVVTGRAGKPSASTSAFISNMKELLLAEQRVSGANPAVSQKRTTEASKELQAENKRLEQENALLKTELDRSNKRMSALIEHLKKTASLAESLEKEIPPDSVPQSKNKLSAPGARKSYEASARVSRTAQVSNKSGLMRMLIAAAMYHPNSITKQRMGALSRMSHTSGSFSNYLSTLRKKNWLQQQGADFTITEEGLLNVGPYEPLPTDPAQLVELWCENVGANSGAARILRCVAACYPEGLTKEALGEQVQMSSSSGSFSNYLSTLRRLHLIQTQGGLVKACSEIFE